MNKRTNKILFVIAVVYMALGVVYAQEPARSKPLSLKEALSRATDSSLSPAERVTGYEAVASRSPAERAGAMRTLAGAADETIAAMAARSMLQDRSPDSAEVISSRISRWSEPNQLAVLQEIQNVGADDSLIQIPREVVRDSLTRKSVDKKHAGGLTALDVAATLMTNSTLATDRSMLGTAALAHPYSRGLWLAIAAQETIEQSESRLADSVYTDSDVPKLIRAAAAAASAAKNKAAEEFVTKEISSFLARFSNQMVEGMLKDAYSSTDARANIVYFRQHLRLLGVLRFLRTSSSENLTFDGLSTPNQEIRMTLGLVAAMRWPERLLKAEQGAFSNSEQESLLVAVSLLHPHLATLVETKVGSSQFSAIRDRFRKYGLVGVFGAPGTVAQGG